ncbi:hypothetical protein GCM10018790_20800 [Kitasatospora xanthocidica]|nr:hypothetical protein KPHV_26920 [Kitasatospora purpeofusca]GHF42787.1 hypothetical protein GCM10018790_20800 [Kitasatospora xanthocidica]
MGGLRGGSALVGERKAQLPGNLRNRGGPRIRRRLMLRGHRGQAACCAIGCAGAAFCGLPASPAAGVRVSYRFSPSPGFA